MPRGESEYDERERGDRREAREHAHLHACRGSRRAFTRARREDRLQLLAADERAHRHRDDAGRDDGGRNAEEGVEAHGAHGAAPVERLEGTVTDAERERAEHDAADREGPVEVARRHRDDSRAGAVPGNDEPGAEEEAAGELGPQERLGHRDLGEIEDADPGEERHADDRGHDRAEHDLQDAQVRQVELRREVACAAEPRALEREPERDTDERSDEEPGVRPEETVREERERHRHSFLTNGATR